MVKIFLKAAAFFALFCGLWYLLHPAYNRLIASAAFFFAPLYDGLGITHRITASGNEIRFTIMNVVPGLIEKSFSNNFNFAMVLFPPLLLSTIKKPLRILTLYLAAGLLLLALWNTFCVISWIKLTYATELDRVNRVQVDFSSKHFTPGEVKLYKTAEKFSWHGTRILPVFLWLFFLLLSKRRAGLPSSKFPVQRPGRNAPCPCGSGLKFKHCCGKRR